MQEMVAVVGWDNFLQLRGQLFLMHDEPGAIEAVEEASREAAAQRQGSGRGSRSGAGVEGGGSVFSR